MMLPYSKLGIINFGIFRLLSLIFRVEDYCRSCLTKNVYDKELEEAVAEVKRKHNLVTPLIGSSIKMECDKLITKVSLNLYLFRLEDKTKSIQLREN